MPNVTKTFKYKLDPTPQQAMALAHTKGICNWLNNTALEQRRAAWQMRRSTSNGLGWPFGGPLHQRGR